MDRTLAVLSLASFAVCAALGACTTSSGGSGGSTPQFDASNPEFDASMPGPDVAETPEATVEEAPSPEAAPVEASAPIEAGHDATADAAVEASTPTCATFDAAIEYDASSLDGATSVNAEGGTPLPGPPPSVCSLLGDTHAPLEVINNSPCPIDVWWVGYDCQEYYYGSAAPNGGTFNNDTWETSPWRLRLAGSEALVEELPALPEGAPDTGLRVFTYP